MDLHYNAFISYRHHPDDIRVASEVHRALERFKVPKAIKKKVKNKGNMRLFRDKEELPITSNLNDDIGEALRNSDYLIVICSVHTKESIWVQREIELFLKSHDRSRVLTVLASGEPYDVIPEILLYDDKVDPITGEMTRTLVEPLSCDWRMKRRKAIREELPRLAAPLLFCAYDELRQRQRQYRMRRLVTFFSIALAASLGLAGYFLQTSITIRNQNVQIQRNLEQAQRNQSRHLATASRERLSEGDRMTAISLAAAALPDETGNRPYVPEAEYALAEALGLYQEYTRTLAVGAVSPGSQATIKNFWTDPKEERLFLYDMRNHITVWDTHTMEKLGDWNHSEELLRTLIPLEGGLALVEHSGDGGNVLKCVKSDGSTLWQMENCVDVTVTEAGTTVLVIAEKGLMDYELRFLDPKTGEDLRKAVSLNRFSGLMSPYAFYPCNAREGMPVIIEYSAFPDTKMCMFDWESGEHKELPVELKDYAMGHITTDGKLVAMTYAESEVFSGVFEDNRVNSTMRRTVACYDLENAAETWKTEITSSVSGNASINEIPGGGRILCQSGPVFQVLDIATGETLNRCEAGSSAVAVIMDEQYARAVLEDGYVCNYWYDENYCYEDKCLQSGLSQASIGQTIFSLQRYSNQVTIYRSVEPPALWLYDDYGYVINVTDQRIQGDQWLIREFNTIHLFDLQTRQIRWTLETPIRELLDFSQDGSKFWFIGEGDALQTVDTATGNVTTESLEPERIFISDCYAKDRTVYYLTDQYTQNNATLTKVNILDLNTNQKRVFEISEEEETLYYSLAGQWEQYLWIWEQSGKLLELDLTTGDCRMLAEEIVQCPAIAVKNDGTVMAITNLEQVLLMTPGAEDIRTIPMEADTLAGSVYYYGDDLLVMCDNGYLYRYDPEGTLLSRTELDVSDTFSRDLLDRESATRANIDYQVVADGKLMVNAFDYGNVIDTENWKISVSVPKFQLYRESDNSFVCSGNSGICAYPVYSLQQLRELAMEKLGSYQLTEDQKTAYGLE